MPRRQPVATRQRLGGDRLAARIERDVDDGRNREQAFAR
jgi:hypothetical protein